MPDADPDLPRRWAELRFSVIGPLLASPPPRGELQQAIASLADRTWQDPVDGSLRTFGFSTGRRRSISEKLLAALGWWLTSPPPVYHLPTCPRTRPEVPDERDDLAGRLVEIGDVVLGVMERPQSRTSDFYRELGELFGVDLSPANRYGGFKALRARWRSHIKSNLFRPVLLIDEAQEMPTDCLNELRLLSSAHFDSESLLTTVLCGDTRLPDRFRSRKLLPLGSRIRTRLLLDNVPKDELRDYLDHLVERAGAPQLLTDGLRDTLVDHAGGNPRIMTTMAAELLDHGLDQERTVLDEALFLDVFDLQRRKRKGAS